MTHAATRRPVVGILLLAAVGAGLAAGAYWHAPILRMVGVAAHGDTAHGDATQSPASAAQLWTCGMHPQVIQDHPGTCPICHMALTPLATGADAATSTGAMVQIDPTIVQNMGIRTAEVTVGPLVRTIRAAARVTEPESRRVDINLRVSGWIQALYANTDGMYVRKGDPLFDLYSPELTLPIEELIAACRTAQGAGASPQTDGRGGAAILASAAEQRLISLGLTTDQVAMLGALDHAPPVVTFFSPVAGHVEEKAGVNAGSAVMPGQAVLRIADRSTMWIEGRVPEGALGGVELGRHARARIDAFPGRTFEGDVIFVHPHLDDATRTALVRVEVSNADELLRSGMYAILEIDSGDAAPVVRVPREAIIDSGESRLVFVPLGQGRFEPRTITIGRHGDHGVVEVLSGLASGEQVVASGQFLLDSESRLREAVAKFLQQKNALAPLQDGTPSPTFRVSTAKVDAIVAAYLPLAEALGAVQKDATPLHADALVSAIHALHTDVADPGARRLLSTAATAAEALKGKPLDAQRELFKALSTSMIALVDAMPPSPNVSESLWIVHCPMAPGDWLQRGRDVANPYYADDMKECGTVVRPVAAPQGGK